MRSLPPDVTEGPRADILACVTRHPGTHLRGIERLTGLPLGQVLYHLDRLERMGLVVSSKDAGFRRFYRTQRVGRREKGILASLRSKVQRHVILLLLRSPGLAHKQLQETLGVAGSTLSFHLQRLVARGVIRRENVDGIQAYFLADPALAVRELVGYRESFRDPRVDAFVGNLPRGVLEAAAPPG